MLILPLVLLSICHSGDPSKRRRLLGYYDLAHVSEFMDLADRVCYYLNSPVLMRDDPKVYGVLVQLKLRGQFALISETVDDFITHSLPELEYSLKTRFNAFCNRDTRPLGCLTKYLAGIERPLWKHLPIRWRVCYDHLLRPGPTFTVTLGDVKFDNLDSVYAAIASDEGHPGQLGPRQLEVDETMDKRMFIFRSMTGSYKEIFFVDKQTGKSVLYISRERLPFHWLPSARTIILEDVTNRSIWYLRANTHKEATEIKLSRDAVWQLGLCGDSIVYPCTGVEIPLDYHKPAIVGATRATVDRHAEPLEKSLLGSSVTASIDEHGVITILNVSSRRILDALKAHVDRAMPCGKSYFGGSDDFKRLQEVVRSGYDWELVKAFITRTGWNTSSRSLIEDIVATASFINEFTLDHQPGSTGCCIS